jgi:hypothetical protein
MVGEVDKPLIFKYHLNAFDKYYYHKHSISI